MMEKTKETTKSLEESLDLVPLNPKWKYERSSPYGKCLSESVTTVVHFEQGTLVTITLNGKVLVNTFEANDYGNTESKGT